MIFRHYISTFALLLFFTTLDSTFAGRTDEDDLNPQGTKKVKEVSELQPNPTPKPSLKRLEYKESDDKTHLAPCLINLVPYLHPSELPALVKVSRRCNIMLTSPMFSRFWSQVPIKVNLSRFSLDRLFTCPYELKGNPVEFVLDVSRPRMILRNVVDIFDWMRKQPPSHLTFNLDHPEFLERTEKDVFESSLLLLYDAYKLNRELLQPIRSMRVSNQNFETEDYPEAIDDLMDLLCQNVTHLTLDNYDTRNCFTREDFIDHLKNVTKLTVLNYPDDRNDAYPVFCWYGPFFNHGEDVGGPVTVTALEVKNFKWNRYAVELNDSFTSNISSLTFDNIRFCYGVQEMREIFLPLVERLKSLTIRGCSFYIEDIDALKVTGAERYKYSPYYIQGGLSAVNKKISADAYEFFKQTFGHLETLVLDWTPQK